LTTRRQPHRDRLDGTVIAITGAARGIGRAIAQAARNAGAKIAICDIDESTLRGTATAVSANFASRVDVTDVGELQRFLVAAEEALGPLDAVVNNAGIMPTGPFTELPDELIDRIIAINTLGVIHGTKAALKLMAPRGRGHIVNMCSTMGEIPVPGLAVYNASKAASVLFSDAVRLECRHTGVHISAVLPGNVRTELSAGIGNPPGMPMVSPEQVAGRVIHTIAGNASRRRVYVPRNYWLLIRGGRLIPVALFEACTRLLGADRLMLRPKDPTARTNYHARAARS
jgi:NAD(P)-dependent dehydrogenase (short-subunit alcohol dehydrogenase family)